MVDIENFRKADGSVDWPALKAAEVAAGDSCMTCGHLLLNLFGNHVGPQECHACKSLRDDVAEVRHDDRVRCPHCRHVFSMGDYISVNCRYEFYADGAHEMTCLKCDGVIVVETSVSYTFTSPAIGG
jgi:hypothetical protein